MSLPKGYKYFDNKAIYTFESLKQAYINDYGKHLNSHFDRAEKKMYPQEVFCLDCPDYKVCKGKFKKGCKNRAEAMRIINT